MGWGSFQGGERLSEVLEAAGQHMVLFNQSLDFGMSRLSVFQMPLSGRLSPWLLTTRTITRFWA